MQPPQIGVILFLITTVRDMDKKTTALSLAKQLKYECEGSGQITLNKDTLTIILEAFIEDWQTAQAKTRQTFEKVK